MDNAAFWDKIAPKYAKDPISDQKAYAQTRDRIAQILQPHHRVLEVGCGTGSTALELAGGVDRYIGTDVSGSMIAIAQGKQSADTPAHLRFAVHEAGDLPAGPHDVILALNLLHLLPNVQEVIATIYDALPPGGLFIAKTALMAASPWYVRWAIPPMQWIGKAPFVCSLSEAELRQMLKQAGFQLTESLVQPGLAPRIFTVATRP